MLNFRLFTWRYSRALSDWSQECHFHENLNNISGTLVADMMPLLTKTLCLGNAHRYLADLSSNSFLAWFRNGCNRSVRCLKYRISEWAVFQEWKFLHPQGCIPVRVNQAIFLLTPIILTSFLSDQVKSRIKAVKKSKKNESSKKFVKM